MLKRTIEIKLSCDENTKRGQCVTVLDFDVEKAERMLAWLQSRFGHTAVKTEELLAAQAIAVGWKEPKHDVWICPSCVADRVIASREAGRG